jgi:DNA-binding protein H-NS
MPKPNLSSMSVDALLKLREDISKVLEHKAHEMRSQLSRLGGATEYKQKGPLKGRKVQPKYRSPSGETWAGRGVKPRAGFAKLESGGFPKWFG